MSTKIKHLWEVPQHVPTVAQWIYDEFWAKKARHTPKSIAMQLRRATPSTSIPLSLLALRSDEPIGTINLLENDDDRRPFLTPWLAALFVIPRFRSQGIGSLLVRSLQARAARLGIHSMYLGTDNPEFYAQFGATVYEHVGKDFCIMRLKGPS